MKVILVSSPLEHPQFPQFVCELFTSHPDTTIILLAGVVNVLPLPPLPSTLVASSVVAEVFPTTFVTQALQPNSSEFYELTKNAFSPLGNQYNAVRSIIYERYTKFFSNLESTLQNHFKDHEPTINENGDLQTIPHPQVIFVPGVQDHPALSYLSSRDLPHIYQLDNEVLQVKDIKVASISSGVISHSPSSSNNSSFHPHSSIPVFPNEVTSKEFERRLRLLYGTDVLITNVAPESSNELKEFIKTSPVKIVICPGHNTEIYDLYTKTIIKVSPFLIEPARGNKAHVYKIELIQSKMNSLEMPLDFVSIHLPKLDDKIDPETNHKKPRKTILESNVTEKKSVTINDGNSVTMKEEEKNKVGDTETRGLQRSNSFVAHGKEEKEDETEERELSREIDGTTKHRSISKKLIRVQSIFSSNTNTVSHQHNNHNTHNNHNNHTNPLPTNSTHVTNHSSSENISNSGSGKKESSGPKKKDGSGSSRRECNGLEWFLSDEILDLYEELKRMKEKVASSPAGGSEGGTDNSPVHNVSARRDSVSGWVKAETSPARRDSVATRPMLAKTQKERED